MVMDTSKVKLEFLNNKEQKVIIIRLILEIRVCSKVLLKMIMSMMMNYSLIKWLQLMMNLGWRYRSMKSMILPKQLDKDLKNPKI